MSVPRYYLFYAGAPLGGFQFETMVNSAVMNIFVYTSTSSIVWTFFFLALLCNMWALSSLTMD